MSDKLFDSELVRCLEEDLAELIPPLYSERRKIKNDACVEGIPVSTFKSGFQRCINHVKFHSKRIEEAERCGRVAELKDVLFVNQTESYMRLPVNLKEKFVVFCSTLPKRLRYPIKFSGRVVWQAEWIWLKQKFLSNLLYRVVEKDEGGKNE